MYWHKDGFGFKNLDFFMCVTDVSDDNGPFYCLEKKLTQEYLNHLIISLKTGERNKVDLDNFNKIFNDEKIKLTEKVKAIFLDSFSTFHRGGYCNTKERIMLRICYQTHDAICPELDSQKEFFSYDKSIKKLNTKINLRNFYFLKTPYILKILKNILSNFII